MIVRDYIFIGAAARARIEQALIAAIESWANDWFCENGQAISAAIKVLGVEDRVRFDQQSLVMLASDEGSWCAFMIQHHSLDLMTSALFSEPVYGAQGGVKVISHGLVNSVVVSALGDLGRRLYEKDSDVCATDMYYKIDEIPAQATQPGSGAQAIEVRIGELELAVALSAGFVRRLIGNIHDKQPLSDSREDANLVTLASALEKRRVRVEALLGTVEVSVSALASLSIGDVIQFDKSFSDPAELLFPGTEVKCKGFLGQRETMRALSLAAI